MHVVIVEDEPLVQQRLVRLTEKLLQDLSPRILGFDNLHDAEEYLCDHSPDILLLDLNLRGDDGFKLLKQQLSAAYHTIVVSAYADKAIDAFSYGVLDFVAKPFTEERLQQAFSRLRDNQLRSHYGCRYLSIKKAGAIELVALSDVHFIQADGHYSQVHHRGEDGDIAVSLHSKSIENLALILPENFFRCHRSYIVNMNQVKGLLRQEGSRYSADLKSGKNIPVGRTRINAMRAELGES